MIAGLVSVCKRFSSQGPPESPGQRRAPLHVSAPEMRSEGLTLGMKFRAFQAGRSVVM